MREKQLFCSLSIISCSSLLFCSHKKDILLPEKLYFVPTTYYLVPSKYHFVPTTYHINNANQLSPSTEAISLIRPDLKFTYPPQQSEIPLPYDGFFSTCWSRGTSESSTYEKQRICRCNSTSTHFHVSWLSDFIFYPKPLYKSLHQSFFYSFITILPSESGVTLHYSTILLQTIISPC